MILKRSQKRLIKKIQGMSNSEQLKTIQAMGVEGVQFEVTLDSLLTGQPITGPAGLNNSYTNYTLQVTETYRKYCGEAEFGSDQVRAVVDARVAFISGEGISIAPGEGMTDGHKDLFKKFIEKNKLSSTRLFDVNRTTEMSGFAIVSILPTNKLKEFIPVFGLLHNNRGKNLYQPVLRNPMNPFDIIGFEKHNGDEKVKVNITNAVYIRTGGYGCIIDAPTTKVGMILTEAENYDRALKDMRELNYRCARITPDFQTKSSSETKALQEQLQNKKWKIGQARIGTAEFSFKSPSTGAHDNLKTEAITNLKTISVLTAVPVHWFGWIDQMSNRATAQELYAMVNNGTIMERESIQDGLKESLVKMQEVYINSGGKLITEMTEDFTVKLPIIDLGKFESTVKAYSMLFADEIISEETYRNIVPGIDPIVEAELIQKSRDQELVNKSEIDDLEDDEEKIEENEDE